MKKFILITTLLLATFIMYAQNVPVKERLYQIHSNLFIDMDQTTAMLVDLKQLTVTMRNLNSGDMESEEFYIGDDGWVYCDTCQIWFDFKYLYSDSYITAKVEFYNGVEALFVAKAK